MSSVILVKIAAINTVDVLDMVNKKIGGMRGADAHRHFLGYHTLCRWEIVNTARGNRFAFLIQTNTTKESFLAGLFCFGDDNSFGL